MGGARSQKAGLEFTSTREEDTACSMDFLLVLENQTLGHIQRRARYTTELALSSPVCENCPPLAPLLATPFLLSLVVKTKA